MPGRSVHTNVITQWLVGAFIGSSLGSTNRLSDRLGSSDADGSSRTAR